MNDVTVTCAKCGAPSSLAAWKGPKGAELPSNKFQCPVCTWAFERRPGVKRGLHVVECVEIDRELPLAGGRIR